ncbi:MAG TPA: M1 family aminopeptidase [Thermoanaerobaculia bacterium]|nr:M1 family aminopeptidase [Thermoanaerobaculia bacterium]
MRRALLFLLVLSLAAPAFAQRLPRTVLPYHYELTFAPDFATDRFDGEAVIHGVVSQPLKEIVLNALEIEFLETKIGAQTATVTTEPEIARLTVAEPIPIGPVEIRIRYRGLLNDKLRGLYLGTAKGKKYASTQMEATDARSAFPSFDEPDMKATFSITAIVDQGHTAISNGAQLSDTPGPVAGKHTIRFATTPRMSTYLVALTIGDFQCIRDEADGIAFGICGTPDKMPLAKYAMEATKFIVPWFNQYYGVRYPFGKLDHIGVPDFRSGAMENAGAILYRDAILFLDENASTPDDMRGTAGTISHEVAHMWFGDLVTMRWWDDIWLNEGFASWATSKPLAAWRPDWKMPLRNVAGTAGAINADSLRASRRIRQQASTPDEIDELFDGIAYGKTAAVLRMIESLIGEEAMRQGISSYLKQYSFGNATFHDFSDSIRQASSQPVDAILASFVEQPGVPLLRVSSACEGGETVLTVEQQRFFLEANAPSNDQRWTVPVCYSAGGERKCAILREPKHTIRTSGCGAPPFLNAGGSGYYVVEYSPAMLDALRASVASLGPAERIVLTRDEWNLVRAGRRPAGAFLALADALRGEREPFVVSNILNTFRPIRENIAADADRLALESWVRAYVQPLVKDLGYVSKANESHDDRILRELALSTLVESGGDLSVAREARKIVERDLVKPALDPIARKTLLPLAAAAGDQALYERYLAAMRAAKTPDEYYNWFYSLVEFRDPALIRRTLEWALTPEVKNQDAGGLIGRVVTANRSGRDVAWTWIEQNWDRIAAKLPERMRGTVTSTARVFCDRESLARAKAFIDAHPVPPAARGNAQALERVAQCAALRDLQSASLHEWLSQR